MPAGDPAGYLPNVKRARRSSGGNKRAVLQAKLAENHARAKAALPLRDRERQLRLRRGASGRKP